MTPDEIARETCETPAELESILRESLIDGLRRRGWSRIEAENEADDRIERKRINQERNQ